MNIKSLLLGSAAALVAVSGARAADAVVIAEPEPMEYVRICDTYGVGFYYIPGTETCLKFSGYLRYDVRAGYRGAQDIIDKDEYLTDDDYDTNDSWEKLARFALRVDARQETELGTLRGFTTVEFNFGTGQIRVPNGTLDVSDDDFWSYQSGNDWNLAHAYIELGGFRVGKTDSLFTTFTGYSSGVMNDGLVPYGPFDTHQMAYTFTGGNGFTAAIALEAGGGGYEYGETDWSPTYADIYTIDSYIPHVVGGIGWTGGWGGVSVVAGYDSVWEEVAVKGRVDFTLGDAFSMFVMGGWGSHDGDFEINGVEFDDSPNFYAPWGGDWAVWVGGAWTFNEKTAFNFEVGYDDFDQFSVAANVSYELVNNFVITPEVFYYDRGDYYNAAFDEVVEGDDEWGAMLRFQYNWGG